MNSKGKIVRPVRIQIDEVQVDTGGETGGHNVYKLAAMTEDYALFRKAGDSAADTDPANAAVPPTV
jgi:hypothetical protein